MVKKIGGKSPSGTKGTTPVQPTKTIESSKIGKVDQLRATESQKGAGKVSGGSPRITAANREQLFQLIDEEADRMFSTDGLPESKKETVKGAVKMAIESGIVEEDEEEKGT